MAEIWGHTATQQPIWRVSLHNGGLTVNLTSFGATLQDIRLEGHAFPLILGYPDCAPFLQNPYYLGTTVGRVANRIAHGRCRVNGRELSLPCNSQGHHLHGGPDGLSFRNWTLLDHGKDFATFQDTLPDGHMGYPGTLTATQHVKLTAAGALVMTLTAQTDAATLCNLTTHPYFHLDQRPDLGQHVLQVHAQRVTEVDDQGIPTGRTPPIAGSTLDYTTLRPLMQDNHLVALDHNFCLSDTRTPLKPAARLVSRDSGISLRIATTEPGLQVYTMARARVPDALALNGAKNLTGVALEPQVWPDAPNHAHFPSILLLPGETYRHQTVFEFSTH